MKFISGFHDPTRSYLSGLSEAHTESIMPTSRVPWEQIRRSNSFQETEVPSNKHRQVTGSSDDAMTMAAVAMATGRHTHHGVLRVGLLVMHLADLLLGGAVDLAEDAEPLTAGRRGIVSVQKSCVSSPVSRRSHGGPMYSDTRSYVGWWLHQPGVWSSERQRKPSDGSD